MTMTRTMIETCASQGTRRLGEARPAYSRGLVPCASLNTTRRRRGISLLEVLISAFVMSVGILSLLALIPVGGYQIAEANKLDRAASVGRSAFREVKVQGLLEADRWMWPPGTVPSGTWPWTTGTYPSWPTPTSYPAHTATATQNVDDWGFPVCIDPLLISLGATLSPPTPDDLNWPGQAFPYANLNPPFNNVPYIPRVNVSTPGITGVPINFGTAERIFTSQDDPSFDVSEPTELPGRMFVTEDGTPTGLPLHGQWNGEFSWMMVVNRAMSDVALSSGANPPYFDISPARRNLYDVAVLVFHRRNLDAMVQVGDMGVGGMVPSERTCVINFGSYGSTPPVTFSPGGGSVVISVEKPATSRASDAIDWLNVRPEQWIGLTYWKRMPEQLASLSGTPPSGLPSDNIPPATYPVIRWYKVLSVGEVRREGNIFYRPLTLSGPDWNSDDMATGTAPYAIILDHLVGVFQKTVTRN